jgi:hypothetical protein
MICMSDLGLGEPHCRISQASLLPMFVVVLMLLVRWRRVRAIPNISDPFPDQNL